MLVYLLAAVLCCLYASDTVIIAFQYRFYTDNPSSSKLVLIAEALKLAVAAGLFWLESSRRGTNKSDAGSRDGHDAKAHMRELLVGRRPAGRCAAGDAEAGGQAAAAAAAAPTAAACAARGSTPARPRVVLAVQRCWARLPEHVQSILTFSVPAVCYFLTNNLSFLALRLMSAHVYTLLGDLRVITTGLLNYLVLDKHLSRQGVVSLVLLFTGIALGQAATMDTAGGPSDSAQAYEAHQWVAGVALMLLIATLSAVASVYTEWVMNHAARYRHESLNLQNMRLYVVGVVLNGLYFVQSGGLVQSFAGDMRVAHWVVTVILACMGLVTAVLIKRYGNIIKVYASSVASLFAAAISHTLLHDPPPPLFYVGVVLAMVATLQLQRARAHQAEEAAAGAAEVERTKTQQGGGWGWGVQQGRGAKKAVLLAVPVAAVTFLLLLLAVWGGPGSSGSSSGGVGKLGPTTDAPMAVLPPFEPTCFVPHEDRHKVQCPVIKCSVDRACSTSDKTCCAYINLQMMLFFDAFLTSKGLEGQYMLVYGSALGAFRDGTVLPHTSDVDFAMSPKAVRVLEQNQTRAKLWSYGYSFWADKTVWRMCPHQHHPSPDFQALMLPLNQSDHVTRAVEADVPWLPNTGTCFLDGFLMWPVAPDTLDCTLEDPHLDLEAILEGKGPRQQQRKQQPEQQEEQQEQHQQRPPPHQQQQQQEQPRQQEQEQQPGRQPLPHQQQRPRRQQRPARQHLAEQAEEAARGQDASGSSPFGPYRERTQWQQQQEQQQRRQLQQAGQEEGQAAGQTFCLHRSRLPVVLTHSRPAVVDGHRLPAAEDLQGHMQATYGVAWRSPDLMNHGQDPDTPDVDRVRAALHQRLSVTVWGDTPWEARRRRCEAA